MLENLSHNIKERVLYHTTSQCTPLGNSDFQMYFLYENIKKDIKDRKIVISPKQLRFLVKDRRIGVKLYSILVYAFSQFVLG